MIKKISLVFCCCLLVHEAFACLQEYRVNLDGTLRHSMGRDFSHEHVWEMNPGSVARLKELDSLWKTNKYIEDYSDYGVQLVYLKRYKEALLVFQKIEKMEPGRYQTMANIGTTYELLGQNELALEWIKKAVAKNPDSHYGSEWLHFKILEAKIKGPASWNSTFLLGTDFGTDSIPTSTRSKDDLDMLAEHMYRQLYERMMFIKPKDDMMGLLLFEYGNVAALAEDATSSYRIYKIAKTYGYSGNLFDKRYEYAEKLQTKIEAYENKIAHKNKTATQNKPPVKEPQGSVFLQFIFFLSLLLIIGTVLFFSLRKKKK